MPAIVAVEAELCWSLVSATLPLLKNFIKSFATGFGHDVGLGVLQLDWPDRARVVPQPRPKRNGSSIPLGRISRKIWHAEKPGDFVSDPQSTGYATEVCSGHGQDVLPRISGGSQELIIRKDVTLSVDRG